MTLGELKAKLTEIGERDIGDPESNHIDADELLLLEYIHDEVVTKAFESIRKWYA